MDYKACLGSVSFWNVHWPLNLHFPQMFLLGFLTFYGPLPCLIGSILVPAWFILPPPDIPPINGTQSYTLVPWLHRAASWNFCVLSRRVWNAGTTFLVLLVRRSYKVNLGLHSENVWTDEGWHCVLTSDLQTCVLWGMMFSRLNDFETAVKVQLCVIKIYYIFVFIVPYSFIIPSNICGYM